MYADRFVYLQLHSVQPDPAASSLTVNARQYDISDGRLVELVLDAV